MKQQRKTAITLSIIWVVMLITAAYAGIEFW